MKMFVEAPDNYIYFGYYVCVRVKKLIKKSKSCDHNPRGKYCSECGERNEIKIYSESEYCLSEILPDKFKILTHNSGVGYTMTYFGIEESIISPAYDYCFEEYTLGKNRITKRDLKFLEGKDFEIKKGLLMWSD